MNRCTNRARRAKCSMSAAPATPSSPLWPSCWQAARICPTPCALPTARPASWSASSARPRSAAKKFCATWKPDWKNEPAKPFSFRPSIYCPGNNGVNKNDLYRHRRSRIYRVQPGQGAQRARRTRYRRGRQFTEGGQVQETARIRDCRFPGQGRFPETSAARRFRRKNKSGATSGRLLGHDGNRRPLHDAEQLPILIGTAELLPVQARALPVCDLGLGLLRRQRIQGKPRICSAAERLCVFVL